ncbi:MAG: alpha/beta hydrolase [Arenimonas sp.]|nr:alpha/beta hydrolase [Arenimonas sp.]MBP7916866.1 alpha/beta hydrolase [Arenimonas sp.]
MPANHLYPDLNTALDPAADLRACAALLAGLLFSAMAFGAAHKPTSAVHTYSAPVLQTDRHQLSAPAFGESVRIDVFLPPEYAPEGPARYPSLYINDGQDAEALALKQTLQHLYAENSIAPVIVVAVSMLPDRMASYGFSERGKQRSLPAQTRFGAVGARAHEYSEWLAGSLVPFIDSQYRTMAKPEARTILGWSLGAANAFSIGWNYPDTFGRVGGFSPSFWLSAVSGDASRRLAPRLIADTPMPGHFDVWLAAGTAEETDDRDGDGVIDVLDDAQDVIDALNAKARQSKQTHDFRLTRMEGGQHNQASWKMLLPGFLQWAYPVVPP